MTKRKFVSETSPSELQVGQVNFFDEKFVGLKIYCPATEVFKNVNLTIKDAELLMDELHRVISQIEGGNNE